MNNEQRIEDLRRRRQDAVTPGNQRAVDRQHDLGKITARERIDVLLDKGSFQELDIFVRHQASGFGIEANRPSRRCGRHRVGHRRRAHRLRLRRGLHRVRGQPGTGGGRQDLQGDGPGDGHRRSADRAQGFRRCPHPGRGGRPRRIRQDLRTQRPGLGCDPADLGDHGTLRRRRRLLPRHHRLRVSGRRHLTSVHHRTGCDQGRHR